VAKQVPIINKATPVLPSGFQVLKKDAVYSKKPEDKSKYVTTRVSWIDDDSDDDDDEQQYTTSAWD